MSEATPVDPSLDPFDPTALFRAALGEVAARVDRAIAPGDEMFEGNEQHYFKVGLSALECIALGQIAARAPAPRSILDLPCGHGRVLRFLRAAWPDARITACDILRDGVAYCAEAFGAEPVFAEVDPEATDLPADAFDLVWVGSLLTHMSLAQWQAFQRVFYRSLRIGGLLAFTTHGRGALRRFEQGERYRLDPDVVPGLLETYEREGFSYASYPTCTHYGICLASPEWVVRSILGAGALRVVTFKEGGWDEHQDLYVCRKLY